MAKPSSTERLKFELRDIASDDRDRFGLLLLMDVVEHIEDPFCLLGSLKLKSEHKVLHIPLDIPARAVVRGSPLVPAKEQVGHIHYFTEDLALRFLGDVGYEVTEHPYTCVSLELPRKALAAMLARILRRAVFGLTSLPDSLAASRCSCSRDKNLGPLLTIE